MGDLGGDGEYSQLGLEEEREEKPLMVSTKLILKLKRKGETAINNKGKKLDPSGRSDGGEESMMSICGQCGKEFSSRKALAGHMRVHMEPQRSSANGNGALYGERPTCTICKKSFHSEKSLFGHMRCHPERGYRGMNPPPPTNNSSRPPISNTSDDQSDHHLDDYDARLARQMLLLPLPPQCRKRRTCGGGAGVVVRVDVDEDEMEMGAVYGLMLLATGDEFYRFLPPKPRDDGIRVWEGNYDPSPEEVGSSSGNKKRRVCGDNDGDMGKNQMDEDSKEEKEYKLEMVVYDMEAAGIGTSSGKKRKMKEKTSQLTVRSYTCSICNKCFSTPQALGGHTSSAHNSKTLIKNAGGQEQVVVVEDGVNLDECAKEELLTGIHVCKTCDKMFPSGRALGGHMRLHYTPPVQGEPNSHAPPPLSSQAAVVANVAPPPLSSQAAVVANVVVEEAEGQGEEQVAKKKVLMCLDLNEIPVDETDC